MAARDNLAEKNGLKLDFVDKIYDIPFERSPIHKNNIVAFVKLKKIIKKENYDIIHCNTPVGGALTRFAAKKARKNGTEVFYTAHGFHFYKGAPLKNWLIYYPLEKYMSRYTDKLITITEEDYWIAKKKFHCDIFRIHGVGVDGKRFHPVSTEEKIARRKKLGLRENYFLILSVGELLPNKNQKMAINMMKELVTEHPDATLLIAGNGSERTNLVMQVLQSNLMDYVQFLDYCTNIEDYYQAADVLVACSYREGLPLNVVEAKMCGLPVIATDNRGHRELIKDKDNLINADDTRGMFEAVKRIIEGRSATEINDEIMLYEAGNVITELEDIYSLRAQNVESESDR